MQPLMHRATMVTLALLMPAVSAASGLRPTARIS